MFLAFQFAKNIPMPKQVAIFADRYREKFDQEPTTALMHPATFDAAVSKGEIAAPSPGNPPEVAGLLVNAVAFMPQGCIYLGEYGG
jgi:hypothetical protein